MPSDSSIIYAYMFLKLGFMAALVGFSFIGLLLATGHFGFAIKVTSYIYFLLLVSTLLGIKGKNERS